MSGVFIEKEMIQSRAFRNLSGTAITVFLDFMCKRRLYKAKKRQGRAAEYIVENNGQIEYCYSEALKKDPPISRVKFAKALDQLVECGFIDIAKRGSGGLRGDKSLYAVSDRWKRFGSQDFKHAERHKDQRKGRGYAAFWKKKRSNIGIEIDTHMSIENDTP